MSNVTLNLAPGATVASALEVVTDTDGFHDRIEALTAYFLGRPYLAFTLVGNPDRPEELVTRLDGFDCVTFAESVYALARAEHPSAFARHLRMLRYLDGRVNWAERNHYMNRWISRNIDAGLMEPLLAFAEIETGEVRELTALPGYPVQRWPVRYVPTTALATLERHAQPGDLVAFVSNRPNLDTFHVGVLMPARRSLSVMRAELRERCLSKI